jgi:outer membrane protein assembly factor BamB/SAM-dependent methyltransferase
MNVRFRPLGRIGLIVSLALGLWHGSAAGGLAEDILTAADATGPLVVHVGCGDGKLTAALGAGGGRLVHGLDSDAKNVRAARKHIASRGVYGRVSADTFDGRHLPYIDNFANLVVCEDLGDVAMTEVMRVLAPGGVAQIKTGGRWTRTPKPRPKEIDEWTHYLHGPDNNAVSRDTVVGPPTRIQWVAGPRWARSHDITPSIQGMVSSAGRMFYVHDEGPIGLVDERFPSKWSLVARDAFNGFTLWKRPVGTWTVANRYWLQCTPAPNRRIVADAKRVYVALGAGKPVTVYRAADGRILAAYKGTESAGELVHHKGVLLAATCGARGRRAPRGKAAVAKGSVTALNTATGQRMWRLGGNIGSLTLAALGDAALFMDGKDVVCVDLKTGSQRWRAASDSGSLIAHEKAVLILHSKGITAHSPADGKVLWRNAQKVRGFVGPAELFVIDGMVWPSGTGIGLDLKTGEVKRRISVGSSPGHHHRCHQRKATVNYLLNSKRGIEFFDIRNKQQPRLHDWLRGNCRLGIVPANGLLYIPTHACFCYPGVMLEGFNALAPASESKAEPPVAKAPRLEKGPGYDKVSNSKSGQRIPNPKSEDWPTYRHDPARSGRASCKIAATLKQGWKVKLAGAGRLTPPVVAGGVVYVADVDAHQIHALKSDDGSRLWTFTAGGRIDSPPTIAPARGLCVFGSRDGYVYCLRSSDGELVWRFRAAPADRRLGSRGQIESVWPVHGSVLVRNGVVYAAAGRSSFVDGGLSLYALDLATGEVRHQKRLYDKPMTLENPAGSGPMDMLQGAKTDIMVSDGRSFYMSRVQFDDKLAVSPSDSLNPHGRRKTGLHLSATSGFLDDTYFNRTFWTYARVWPGYALAASAPKSGQILSFDDQTTYSIKVFDQRGPGNHFRSAYFKPGSGFLLCADDNSNEPQQSARVKGAESSRPDQIRTKPAKWTKRIPMRVRAMVLADRTLLLAGPRDEIPADDPLAHLEGRRGASLWAVSTRDGKKLAEYKLTHQPVFDGIAAADGALLIVLDSREIVCFK